MLSVGWVVAAVVLAIVAAIVVSMWFTFTLTRLDRLHARVDAAGAAMDAQLVRRAAALQHVAEWADSGLPDADRARFDLVARRALGSTGADPAADDSDRERVENAVGRAVLELAHRPDTAGGEAVSELREAAARVLIARRFYNDAVRDTRALRTRRLPRWLHMAGRREMPRFFDIDDTQPGTAAFGPQTVSAAAVPITRPDDTPPRTETESR